MTVLAVFAYGFIAYGPVAALFGVTVARQAHEVIIMMASAFFWLLSIFFSSILWKIVLPLHHVPAFTLPFSVILQEFFRWLCYKLICKGDKVLEIVSDDKSPLRKHKVAYVAGMGYGVIAGIVAFANVLRESGGPGIVGIGGSGSQFFVLASAFATNALIILHICWGVLWFNGWETKNWANLVVTFLSHMFVSALSLMNMYDISTAYFLVTTHLIATFLIGYALYTAGARPKTLIQFFKI